MKTVSCVRCGDEFSYEPVMMCEREFGVRKWCPSCSKLMADAEAEQGLKAAEWSRREEWKRMCPTIYRDTNAARLPAGPLAKVMAWKLGPKGLVITGPTGRGKTRAAMLLMERLHVNEGRSVEVFHGNGFAHQCAREFGNFVGEDWIDSMSKKDVVFFDDLGKFKLTERVEAELFGLIEMRVAWAKPIVATLNFGGDALAGKMTADRGEPMVRRLREFCESVAF